MGFACGGGEYGENWECGWPEEVWREARSGRAVVKRVNQLGQGGSGWIWMFEGVFFFVLF